MSDTEVVSEAELRAYRAELRVSIFRQIHQRLYALKEAGFTQEEMARTIGMQPAQLSRLLRGENDLQLDTLADLARGLGCRIVTSVQPLQPVPRLEKTAYFKVSIGGARVSRQSPTASNDAARLQIVEAAK